MALSASSDCLSEQAVAAWVAGRLGAGERASAEAHLAHCSRCLTLVGDAARRTQGEDAGPSPWPWGANPKLLAERFEQNEFIARGGTGNVYAGFDRQTGERVAIKQLRAELAGSPDLLARFAREGEIISRLDHPNIVKTLAVIGGEEPYIVMEYVAGGSLRQLLTTPSLLPLSRALSLSLELCDALSRAHHLKVIHRDIKPENLLLSEDGTLRLTDFGLARRSGDSGITASGTVVGTVAYMSPELLWGHEANERSDIWAMGLVLFEMLVGNHPFVGSHMPATMQAILHRPLPQLLPLCPAAPPALADLLRRMLEKEPALRIHSARQVGAELEMILSASDAPAPVELGSQPLRESQPPLHNTLRSMRSRQHNLPFETSLFIGREDDSARVLRLLRDPLARLVTLLGPGGMGKSRVALQVCRRLLAASETAFEDGLFFVDLAPLASAELIISAVAEALGLQFQRDRAANDQVLTYLQGRRVLLLLDNFEHLHDGAAAIVSELLRRSPDVKLLATSRQPVGLQGEYLLPLEGLDTAPSPNETSRSFTSAERLFVESARRVRPSYEPDAAELLEVSQICRQVEGLPLGIVLAASWAGVLATREISIELSKSLDFLRSNFTDVPRRQQSARAVFEHSWRVLDERERWLLQQASVFRGGFTREAAEFVAGADLTTLAALVNKSLLQWQPERARYAMHALVREYAEAKLGEQADDHVATLERHADYFANFLAKHGAQLRDGAHQRAALRTVRADLGNIRWAWRVMTERKWSAPVERAIDALMRLYEHGARAEAELQFQELVEAFGPPDRCHSDARRRVVGVAMTALGMFRQEQGRDPEGAEILGAALELLREQVHPSERAEALALAGLNRCGHGSRGRLAPVEESIELCRTIGDSRTLAWALHILGGIHESSGALTSAIRCFEESVQLQRERGAVILPVALARLGWLRCRHGEAAQGHRDVLSALDIAEERDDARLETCLHYLALAQRSLGDYAAAEASARRSLALTQQLGLHELWRYVMLADALKEQGRFDEALGLYRTCLAFEQGDALAKHTARYNLGDVALLRGDYATARGHFEDCLARFRELDISWGSILALDGLGYVACCQAALHEALQHLRSACQLAFDTENVALLTHIAAAVALWHAKAGRCLEAIELLELVQQHSATEPRTRQHRVAPLLAELQTVVSPEELAAATERGKSRNFAKTISAFIGRSMVD